VFKSKQALLKVAFILVVLQLILAIVVSIFAPDQPQFFRVEAASLVIFSLVFVSVLILICASFFLWISMLLHIFKFDKKPLWRKSGWLFLATFGLSFGAAIYYWFVYRKLSRTFPSVSSATF